MSEPFTHYVILPHANTPLEEGERCEQDTIRERLVEITRRDGAAHFVSKLRRDKPRVFIQARNGGQNVVLVQVWKTP